MCEFSSGSHGRCESAVVEMHNYEVLVMAAKSQMQSDFIVVVVVIVDASVAILKTA